MDSFLKATIEKLPSWSFHAFAILLCIGICLYFYKTFVINKKFNELIGDVLKRDDRLKEYQEKVDVLTRDNYAYKAESSQLSTCITNVRPYIEALNEIRNMENPLDALHETRSLLQRMIEALAFDIKALSGEQHRCGIWSKNDDALLLICASFGFPKNYPGNRTLELNRSIAGRCFRKNEPINCPNVTKDEDWLPNQQSKSPYKSLICIPLNYWGVLTIDALEPLSSKCLLIGELYASIIDGIMLEYYKTASYIPVDVPDDEENAS